MKKKKPKTLREKTKNSAVKPQLNLKSRYEELEDINSYFNDLPKEAQDWMTKYTENHVNASFKKDKEDNFTKDNLLTESSTRVLLKQYIVDIKNYKGERKVRSFVDKYLIREDNVPLSIIKEMFFENNDKKLLELAHELKEELTKNVNKTSKREVNKIMKLIENEVYNLNNARNRCIITKSKAAGQLNYIEDLDENDLTIDEDDLIERIDLKTELDKIKKD